LPRATEARIGRAAGSAAHLALSCTAIGAAAAALAIFVGWGCGDMPAAALIVVLAGAALEVVLRAAAVR
jgi:hypothetical protein